MSIVVDATVVVAALLGNDDHSDWAEALMVRGMLQAPELVLAEVTNILRRLERAKLITSPQAAAARDDLMQLDVQLFPFEPFADRIWELRHHVTSYDAWYVAIAEVLELPLATLDEPLSKSDGVTCRFLTPGF